jgi:ferredoxin
MKVKFLPQGTELEIKPDQSVLELAHENGIPIRSTCNGMPSCAECRVKVVEGEYNLIPPSKKETSLIGTGYYIDQRRLSCQMHCFGDVTIDIADHMAKENEGPITKKFLSRVQKKDASDTHSVGGIFIEQEVTVLKQVSESISESVSDQPTGDFLGDRPRRGGGGQPRGGGQRGGGGNQQRQGQRPQGQRPQQAQGGQRPPQGQSGSPSGEQPQNGQPRQGGGKRRRRGRR